MRLLIAVGIHEGGAREILGFQVAAQESRRSWGDLFTQLLDRGLHGVELVVSDSHKGLVRAIEQHFPSAQWQRCQVHLARNVLDRCPPRWQASPRPRLRQLFNSGSKATGRRVFAEISEAYGTKAVKAVELLEAGLDAATAVLALPWKYQRKFPLNSAVRRGAGRGFRGLLEADPSAAEDRSSPT